MLELLPLHFGWGSSSTALQGMCMIYFCTAQIAAPPPQAQKKGYADTMQNGSALIRTAESICIGLHQYWVEGSPGNTE
eukprot:1051837-Pelagomonas_calceolata.AAC.1